MDNLTNPYYPHPNNVPDPPQEKAWRKDKQNEQHGPFVPGY
jgi:hypothetical protein